MKATVIPIITGALGTIPRDLVKKLEELEIGGRAGTICYIARYKRMVKGTENVHNALRNPETQKTLKTS